MTPFTSEESRVWLQTRRLLMRGRRPTVDDIESAAPREQVAEWMADEVDRARDRGAQVTLRPWQSAALPVALDALRCGGAPVVQAATGSGKSVLIAEVLARLDAPAVVTAPTQHLVEQLAATLAARGLDVGRYYADRKESGRVLVVCHDSIDRADTAGRWWIADEAHRVTFDLPGTRGRLGFTATPYPPGTGSLTRWDRLVFRYGIDDALRDGVLVPFEVEYQPHDADVDQATVELLRRRPPRGAGVVSATSIADAVEYADRLASEGLPSAAVHSRMPRAERARVLDRLRVGDLRAVVFPELLSEGVDLPWLEWLVLRRKVNRRRLVQQVGRVVRCSPGKDRAVVYDPHDLLATHGIVHTAALGALPVVEEPDEDVPDDWPVWELPPLGREVPQAVAVDAMGAWVRGLLLSMELGTYHDGDPWRREPCSQKQAATLARLKWTTRFLPPEHRPAVNVLVRRAPILRRGVASDLLTVLMRVAEQARPWIERQKAQGRDPWRLKAPPVALDLPSVPSRLLKAMERAA